MYTRTYSMWWSVILLEIGKGEGDGAIILFSFFLAMLIVHECCVITHFLFNKGGAGEGGGAIILAVEGVKYFKWKGHNEVF